MPFCPICHAEFREGFTRCNTCETDLVERLEEEMDLSSENIREALAGKELVGVTRGTLDVVKETRELLASRRIAAIIVEDDAPKIEGVPPRVVLVVGKDDVEAAAKVLGSKFLKMVQEEGVESKTELKYEDCPACGTPVPEDAEECPECGLFIGKA